MPLLAVNHHYFREAGTGRGIHPVTPDALRAELETIRAGGWRVGGEADIAAMVDGTLDADDRVCVMTFDDGLKEQLAAIALLQSFGACAVCFVPTRPLTERIVLDVHKVHMIHAALDPETMAADLDRRYGFSGRDVDEALAVAQYPYDTPLTRRVKYVLNFVLADEQRADWIERTFTSMFGDERSVADSLYMNKDEVRALAARGLLGSHAHAHVALAPLSDALLRAELERSRDVLEDLTGRAPAGVSYPFGSKFAIGPRVYAEAKRAGYDYGLTMTRGINLGGGDPFALLRVNINDVAAYL
jgi:peptidoglycan/xylan/chitin deacetylase (PgdA/CDA1 family)